MDKNQTAAIIIGVSELIALLVIVRAWRLPIHWAEKVGVTLVALIPVAGPVFALFLSNDPGPAHPALRDNVRSRTDVLDRWRHVLDEKDPVARQRKWQELMGNRRDGGV